MRKASHFAKVLWTPSRNAWQVRLNKGRGKLYRKEFQDQEKANEHAAELNENIPMEGAFGYEDPLHIIEKAPTLN